MKKTILAVIIFVFMLVLISCMQKETKPSSLDTKADKTISEQSKTEAQKQVSATNISKQNTSVRNIKNATLVTSKQTEPYQQSTIHVNLSYGNKTIGYFPKTTIITDLVKGNYVKFNESGVEIIGVYNNAVVVRIHGVLMGEKFTVAKGAPIGENTKDGRIRIAFMDDNSLYVENIT